MLRTLSFLRKQESLKNADSCFRRNDSGTGHLPEFKYLCKSFLTFLKTEFFGKTRFFVNLIPENICTGTYIPLRNIRF